MGEEKEPETLLLVDLSSIIHPLFHVTASDPDPNASSVRTVEKVRALASGQRRVAICCDTGKKTFRSEIDPTYKADRPEGDERLNHQVLLSRETLIGDGFPVWVAVGVEADDIIATATKKALEADLDVVIATADKDLLQLVGPHVSAKSLKDGSIIDEAGVLAKLDVRPEQVGDYLCLVGDKADNVRGAKGIGPKGAAALLKKHNSLDALFAKMEICEPTDPQLGLKPSELASLAEFKERYPIVKKLISLRDDVEIPFSEVFKERVPKDAELFNNDQEEPMGEVPNQSTPPDVIDVPVPPPPKRAEREPETTPVHETAIVPVEWNKQLEPQSMDQARRLASDMFASRLWSAYGTPAAVLSTVLAGRELGVQAMASLRSMHIIDGKTVLSSDLIRALVLKSGLAEYFRCTERTATRATFVTKRKNNPEQSLTYTIEEARQAWSGTDEKWEKSAWGHNAPDMLVARAGAKLARLEYPEVTSALYAKEEFDQ